jgi:hypothetical protein
MAFSLAFLERAADCRRTEGEGRQSAATQVPGGLKAGKQRSRYKARR